MQALLKTRQDWQRYRSARSRMGAKTEEKLMTPKQHQMLLAFKNDLEASDIYDFDSAGTLAWRNRERVIEALWRRGLLDENGITPAGLTILAETKT